MTRDWREIVRNCDAARYAPKAAEELIRRADVKDSEGNEDKNGEESRTSDG